MGAIRGALRWAAGAVVLHSAGPAWGQSPESAAVPPTTTCAADWAQAATAEVAPSVVRVERRNGDLVGTAFVFGSSTHLATALHVVSGRVASLRARFVDGTVTTFDVVAMDRDHDLAVLRVVAAPVGLRPLRPSTTPAERGAPVMMVRPSDPAPESWEVTTGVVSAVEPDKVVSDVLIRPGNSGGPLVNCAGEVVGVATGHTQQLSTAPSVARLIALWTTAGDDPVFRRRPLFRPSAHIAAVAGTSTEGTRVGPSVSGGIQSGPWMFRAETRVAWLVGRHSATTSEQGTLTGVGMNVQRSVTMFWVGAGAVYVAEERRVRSIDVNAGQPESHRTSTAEFEPLLLAHLKLEPFSLDYQFVIDVDAPRTSTHWIGVGFPLRTSEER